MPAPRVLTNAVGFYQFIERSFALGARGELGRLGFLIQFYRNFAYFRFRGRAEPGAARQTAGVLRPAGRCEESRLRRAYGYAAAEPRGDGLVTRM